MLIHVGDHGAGDPSKDGTFEFPQTYFKRITNAVSDGEKNEIGDIEEVQDLEERLGRKRILCQQFLPGFPCHAQSRWHRKNVTF